MEPERRKLLAPSVRGQFPAAAGSGSNARAHLDDAGTPTIKNKRTDRENMPAFINRMSNSSISSVTNGGRDRYHFIGQSKSGSNINSSGAGNGFMPTTSSVTKQSRAMLQTNTQRTVTLASSSGRYPSLIDLDSPVEQKVMETDLYRRFEEAFEKTLQSNPGLLPGSSPVAKTIKSALYKLRKAKADKESELRRQLEREQDENKESNSEKKLNEMKRQLDKAKMKNGLMEAEMRREMATTAMKHGEINKSIAEAKLDRDRIQAALQKEMEAIRSMNSDLQSQLQATTSEKEHLSHHLNQLSRTRVELESAIASEVKNVERDKHTLEELTVERKAVANEITLERQRLRNARTENNKFEAKIEHLTMAAAKEKEALKREIAEIELLEKHTSDLRRQNQASRGELEREQGRLKEVAAAMETKKATLRDSRREMKEKYDREIEELERGLTRTSRDMENTMTSRVMKFIKQSGARREADDGNELSDAKIEAMIKSQVRNEVDSHLSRSKRAPSRERRRSHFDEVDDAHSDTRDSAPHAAQHTRHEEESTPEDIVEKELGRLQVELNILKRMSSPDKPERMVENARLDRDTAHDQRILRRSKSAVEAREDNSDIREELRCLREELQSAKCAPRDDGDCRRDDSDALRGELQSLRDEIKMNLQPPMHFTSPGRSPGPRRAARRPRTPSRTRDEHPQSLIEDEWRDDEEHIFDRRILDQRSFDRRSDLIQPSRSYRAAPIRRYGDRRQDDNFKQQMYFGPEQQLHRGKFYGRMGQEY